MLDTSRDRIRLQSLNITNEESLIDFYHIRPFDILFSPLVTYGEYEHSSRLAIGAAHRRSSPIIADHRRSSSELLTLTLRRKREQLGARLRPLRRSQRSAGGGGKGIAEGKRDQRGGDVLGARM
jgi:hypothetical protein